MGIMENIGIKMKTVKANHANMFLSPLLAEAFATITGAKAELDKTDGSQGAARGTGIGAGIHKGTQDAFVSLEPVKTIEPNKKLKAEYKQTYENWLNVLKQQLKKNKSRLGRSTGYLAKNSRKEKLKWQKNHFIVYADGHSTRVRAALFLMT